MKIFKGLCGMSIALLLTLSVTAQVVAKQVTDKYSSSVISRVYEVTRVANLSPTKQVSLAAWYTKRDSVTAILIKQNESPESIQALLAEFDGEFNGILNSEERFNYKYSLSREFIENDAMATAAFLAKKYQGNSDLQISLYKAITEKSNGLFRMLDKGIDAADRTRVEQYYLSRYDSLYNAYTVALKGESYFKDQVSLLSTVKPLTETEVTLLRRYYLDACKKKGDDYHKNFNTALQYIPSNKDYYKLLYKDSIESEAITRSKKELSGLVYKYGLHDSLQRKIYPILLDNARKEAELETTMIFNRTRDSLQRDLEAKTWALVKKTMIRAGYYRISNSRFVNAMRFERPLQLSGAQLDSLAEKNYQLDMLAHYFETNYPWKEFNPKYFTSANMEKIFTPGQYDSLLKLESGPVAMNNTYTDWLSLKTYKLTEGLDSASTFKSLFAYNMSRELLSKRYENDRATLNRLMKANESYKPLVLSKLEAIQKQEEWNRANSDKNVKTVSN